ncbi:MAG TPA: ABC transporter permease [Phycisphaerales bacterium]|nr:ABC transporter permease [Phycisphaerales bacterium]
MWKMLQVAKREFVATVLTKAFLIGVFILPVVLTATIPIAGLLVSSKSPDVNGTVAIIDLSGDAERGGEAAKAVMELLSPEAIAAQQKRQKADDAKVIRETVADKMGSAQADQVDEALKLTGDAKVPDIKPEQLPATTDLEQAKQPLMSGTTFDGSRLALVVIEKNAIRRGEGEKAFGGYQLYVKPKLDSRAQRLITDQVGKAIVQTRLKVNGEDPEQVLAMTSLQRPKALAVTKTGEKSSGELQQYLLPMGFMMLLWVSVFTSGQFLMTSTIEEKSNRIMEVLLSAVSPMQLMTGKIVGQMGAGLLIMTVYSGFGIASLLLFNRGDLLEGASFGFLVAFFFIAFFTIAAMMAAVGSAVTDIHEAQALMMPIMLVVMIPMLLMMPIISAPSGMMATVMSFVPPISPFVMVLRMSSSQPPPQWQLFVALGIGVVTVYVALKIAAKVFRVGVLMYGKPPNLATLVKWVRMA